MPDGRIALIWPDHLSMAASTPEDYRIAYEILGEYTWALADPKGTEGEPKQFLVLLLQSRRREFVRRVWSVPVDVVRWVADDPQPGWVEARLTDAHGRQWVLIDTPATFVLEPVSRASEFPVPGAVRCHLMSRLTDSEGSPLARVHTVDTVAEDGTADFEVRVEGLESSDFRGR
jgi:hypothetical protein